MGKRQPLSASMLELVKIDGEAAGLYREIRLAALKTDPSAFSSTYEREAQFSDEVWRGRAASLDAREKVGYFVMKAGVPCALVFCFRENAQPSRASVLSMWVAPEVRRRGLALRLLEAVRCWAESQGISKLRLFVINNNYAAIALYKRSGFRETGNCEAYPNDSNLFEIEMERSTRDRIA